jgi:hypothetical protein
MAVSPGLKTVPAKIDPIGVDPHGRTATSTEQERLKQFQISPEVIRTLQERAYIILDKAPAQWDLDIPYKIAPASW